MWGDNNPAKRPEIRKKISQKLTGRKFSKGHKAKIAEFRLFSSGFDYFAFLKLHFALYIDPRYIRWPFEASQSS
jgi:hypothetical protein